MPSEIKRQIARALIDPPLSRAAEALEIVDWIGIETSAGGNYRESWINLPAGDRGNAAEKLQQRLGSLARVNKEFELIAAELTSKYYILPLVERQIADKRSRDSDRALFRRLGRDMEPEPITYKWSPNHYMISLPMAPRFGAFVRSIIIRTIHSTPSQRTFIAALVPTLYNLDETDMDIPDRYHRAADLVAIAAVARVGKQIRTLRLSLAHLRHGVCACEGTEPGDDGTFTGDSSDWLATYLKDFLDLSVLELEEVDGDHAAHIALAKTLATLEKLTLLRLRARNGFPPPEIAFIPFSAPLRVLWVAQVPNLRTPLPYSDFDVMAPWLANFSSTLETFVWKEGSHRDDGLPPRNDLPVLSLPHLTTLSLARYDIGQFLGASATSPLETFVFTIRPRLGPQLIRDFIVTHPTLKRVLCRGGSGDRGADWGVEVILAVCAEQADPIIFKSDADHHQTDDAYII